MLIPTAVCLLTIAAWTHGECVDSLTNCHLLQEGYCSAPYDVLARQVCAKRCGLCDDDNISIHKRSHNHGPEWSDHCWDKNINHIEDPFCALLTTTDLDFYDSVTPIAITQPTTTTTEPNVTTTEPPTTTTGMCHYQTFNDTDIQITDFKLVVNINTTLNVPVHLLGSIDSCQGICAHSLLADGLECWAFTFNEIHRCLLYYYNRPLQVISGGNRTSATTLYIKRCPADPITTKRPHTTEALTQAPDTQATATTEAAKTTGTVVNTTEILNTTKIIVVTDTVTDVTTQKPNVNTLKPVVVNTTEIVNTTQIIHGTTIITHINGSATHAAGSGRPPLITTATDAPTQKPDLATKGTVINTTEIVNITKIIHGTTIITHINGSATHAAGSGRPPLITTATDAPTQKPDVTTKGTVINTTEIVNITKIIHGTTIITHINGTATNGAGSGRPPLITTATDAPTQKPDVATKGTVINTTEIVNTTKIIHGTAIITHINGTTTHPAGTGPPPLITTSGGVGPDSNSGPGGVVMVSSTSYKISGTPSRVPGTCFFLNKTFNKGERWKDACTNGCCRSDCECISTDTNTALCTDVCPHYTSLPAECTLKIESGQCCLQLDCGNHTELLNTTGVDAGSSNVSTCGDKLENGRCDYYEDIACKGVYANWAKANCALRCGYCGDAPPCRDRLSYCSLYDLDTACVNYTGWARYNCKRACNICTHV